MKCDRLKNLLAFLSLPLSWNTFVSLIKAINKPKNNWLFLADSICHYQVFAFLHNHTGEYIIDIVKGYDLSISLNKGGEQDREQLYHSFVLPSQEEKALLSYFVAIYS